MPDDIGHKGYAQKRSMPLVWENATPDLHKRYERGELPPHPSGLERRAGRAEPLQAARSAA
jgi:hypothetical protein